MSDLSHDVKAKLAAIAQKNKAAEQASQNIVEAPAQAAATTQEAPKPVESAVPSQEEVKKVEEAKAKEQASTTSPKPAEAPKEEAVEFKWDAGLVEETKPASTTFDIKRLGSALQIDANTEDEFVKTVSENLTKLKTLETEVSKVFEGVDPSLKEAIELAKKGGDWQSFIGNSLVDTTKLDPIELFNQEYEKQNIARFKKPDGTIDWDALDTEIDSIPQGVKLMQGNNLKNELYLRQSQRKQQLIEQAQKQQEVFSKQLGEAAKELPNFFPKETFGINIEPQHVASIYDGIASKKLIQKHLGDIDIQSLAKLDAKKLMKTVAMAEWAEGISKHQFKQGEVAGKRQLLEKSQNADINVSGRPAEPETPTGDKPLTAAEKLKRSLKVPANSL